MADQAELLPGTLDLLILRTLQRGPMHGHAIAKAIEFRSDDVLVFGRETGGLPETILAEFEPDSRLRIPMRPNVRSINLSNAVAIAVYEAWRQLRFAGSA